MCYSVPKLEGIALTSADRNLYSAPYRSSTRPHCQSSHLVASGTGVYRLPWCPQLWGCQVVSLYTTPPLAGMVRSGLASIPGRFNRP